MKRLICIELLEEHEAVNFYAIRFVEEESPLIEQFLNNYDTQKYGSDMMALGYWLEKIGERGAQERYFRPEGHPMVKAIPVPPPSSKLRLYCLRLADQVLIIGGGGEKSTRTYQEDPSLARQVTIVETVGKAVLTGLRNGMIARQGKVLSGKLTFEINV